MPTHTKTREAQKRSDDRRHAWRAWAIRQLKITGLEWDYNLTPAVRKDWTKKAIAAGIGQLPSAVEELPELRTAASHRRKPDPEAFTEDRLRTLTPDKPLPVRGNPYALRSTSEDGTHKGLVKLGWSRKKYRRNSNVKNPERVEGPEFEYGSIAEDVLQDHFDAHWDFDEWYKIDWEAALQYLQSEEFRSRVPAYIKKAKT
jgi:hypothetical protein